MPCSVFCKGESTFWWFALQMSVSTSACRWCLSADADNQAVPPGSCHTCHLRIQLHHLAYLLQVADILLSHVLTPYGVIAELGSKFFRVQVIGDFPEAEARLFLEQALGAIITGAEWADIYEASVQTCIKGPFPALPALSPVCFQVECMHGRAAAALASTPMQVCGGNAGDLLSAVQDFKVLKDWASGE